MRADEAQLRTWMIGGLSGDSDAHERLLRALVPLIHAFFRRRMPGRHDEIEDIVQETLIAVHTRRATYDRERAFTAWLYAIARYKMIDHFRRSRRTVPLEDIGDILIAEGFEDACSARIDVADLLSTLPAKQARAIWSTRVQGASVAETADAEGIGQSDVKVSVHRGLRALANRIAKSGS